MSRGIWGYTRLSGQPSSWLLTRPQSMFKADRSGPILEERLKLRSVDGWYCDCAGTHQRCRSRLLVALTAGMPWKWHVSLHRHPHIGSLRSDRILRRGDHRTGRLYRSSQMRPSKPPLSLALLERQPTPLCPSRCRSTRPAPGGLHERRPTPLSAHRRAPPVELPSRLLLEFGVERQFVLPVVGARVRGFPPADRIMSGILSRTSFRILARPSGYGVTKVAREAIEVEALPMSSCRRHRRWRTTSGG